MDPKTLAVKIAALAVIGLVVIASAKVIRAASAKVA